MIRCANMLLITLTCIQRGVSGVSKYYIRLVNVYNIYSHQTLLFVYKSLAGMLPKSLTVSIPNLLNDDAVWAVRGKNKMERIARFCNLISHRCVKWFFAAIVYAFYNVTYWRSYRNEASIRRSAVYTSHYERVLYVYCCVLTELWKSLMLLLRGPALWIQIFYLLFIVDVLCAWQLALYYEEWTRVSVSDCKTKKKYICE